MAGLCAGEKEVCFPSRGVPVGDLDVSEERDDPARRLPAEEDCGLERLLPALERASEVDEVDDESSDSDSKSKSSVISSSSSASTGRRLPEEEGDLDPTLGIFVLTPHSFFEHGKKREALPGPLHGTTSLLFFFIRSRTL